MKAVVAAFNQEKALVGAFSVITNLRMELFEALGARLRGIMTGLTIYPDSPAPAYSEEFNYCYEGYLLCRQLAAARGKSKFYSPPVFMFCRGGPHRLSLVIFYQSLAPKSFFLKTWQIRPKNWILYAEFTQNIREEKRQTTKYKDRRWQLRSG